MKNKHEKAPNNLSIEMYRAWTQEEIERYAQEVLFPGTPDEDRVHKKKKKGRNWKDLTTRVQDGNPNTRAPRGVSYDPVTGKKTKPGRFTSKPRTSPGQKGLNLDFQDKKPTPEPFDENLAKKQKLRRTNRVQRTDVHGQGLMNFEGEKSKGLHKRSTASLENMVKNHPENPDATQARSVLSERVNKSKDLGLQFDDEKGLHHKEVAETAHDPHQQTLETAQPFTQYGPGYRRNIADAHAAYVNAKEAGHGKKMLDHLHGSLKSKIDNEHANAAERNNFGKPNAHAHDEITLRLKEMYKDPRHKEGDSNFRNEILDLEKQQAHHRPAAIQRAEQEIEEGKVERMKERARSEGYSESEMEGVKPRPRDLKKKELDDIELPGFTSGKDQEPLPKPKLVNPTRKLGWVDREDAITPPEYEPPESLVVDPNDVDSFEEYYNPQSFQYNKKRSTREKLAGNALKRERNKKPLFSDQIAEEQPSAKERVDGLEKKENQGRQADDISNRKKSTEAMDMLSKLPANEQIRFVDEWNSAQYPKDPVSMISRLKKWGTKKPPEYSRDWSHVTDAQVRKEIGNEERKLRNNLAFRDKAEKPSPHILENIEDAKQRLDEIGKLFPKAESENEVQSGMFGENYEPGKFNESEMLDLTGENKSAKKQKLPPKEFQDSFFDIGSKKDKPGQELLFEDSDGVDRPSPKKSMFESELGNLNKEAESAGLEPAEPAGQDVRQQVDDMLTSKGDGYLTVDEVMNHYDGDIEAAYVSAQEAAEAVGSNESDLAALPSRQDADDWGTYKWTGRDKGKQVTRIGIKNPNNKQGFGDTIAQSIEEAEEHSKHEQLSHKRNMERQRNFENQEAEKAKAKQELLESYNGFLSESPRTVGRQRKTLEKTIRLNGKNTTRKEDLEDKFASGKWKLNPESGRLFTDELESRKLTKTEHAYWSHMEDSKQQKEESKIPVDPEIEKLFGETYKNEESFKSFSPSTVGSNLAAGNDVSQENIDMFLHHVLKFADANGVDKKDVMASYMGGKRPTIKEHKDLFRRAFQIGSAMRAEKNKPSPARERAQNAQNARQEAEKASLAKLNKEAEKAGLEPASTDPLFDRWKTAADEYNELGKDGGFAVDNFEDAEAFNSRLHDPEGAVTSLESELARVHKQKARQADEAEWHDDKRQFIQMGNSLYRRGPAPGGGHQWKNQLQRSSPSITDDDMKSSVSDGNAERMDNKNAIAWAKSEMRRRTTDANVERDELGNLNKEAESAGLEPAEPTDSTDLDFGNYSEGGVSLTSDGGMYSVESSGSTAAYQDKDEAYANYAAEVFHDSGKIVDNIPEGSIEKAMQGAFEMADESSGDKLVAIKAAMESSENASPPKSVEPSDTKKIVEGAAKGNEQAQQQIASIRQAINESDRTPRDKSKLQSYYTKDEYEWAKTSEVPNSGDDLYGSARHKRNEWRTLEEAEEQGTAKAMVTRDNLLKAEDYPITSTIKDDKTNVGNALLAHLCIKKFPTKPPVAKDRRGNILEGSEGDEKNRELRKLYLENFREVRDKAIELVNNGETNIVKGMREHISLMLKKDREGGATKMYNLLVKTHNGMFRGKSSALNQFDDFAKNLKEAHPEKDVYIPSSYERFAGESVRFDHETAHDYVMNIIEGNQSIRSAFGKKGAKRGRYEKFDYAKAYVSEVSRKGGKSFDANDHEGNTKTLQNDMGIRGLQFGNSMSDDERKHHLAKTTEAFHDMAQVFNIPVNAISINGKLGIAFGARGRAGAMAHYEPKTRVINLTRKNGAGSMSHEWGHFMDNMLGGGGSKFASDLLETPVKEAMSGLKRVYRKSGFLERVYEETRPLGKKQQQYWTSNHEMFARSFERYVQTKLADSGQENSYLVGLRKQGHKLWPSESEVKQMAPHFDKIMEHFSGNTEKYSIALSQDLLNERFCLASQAKRYGLML